MFFGVEVGTTHSFNYSCSYSSQDIIPKHKTATPFCVLKAEERVAARSAATLSSAL